MARTAGCSVRRTTTVGHRSAAAMLQWDTGRHADASAARPLVGVTTYRQTTSWWSWERDAALVPGSYLDMVGGAGGQPC